MHSEFRRSFTTCITPANYLSSCVLFPYLCQVDKYLPHKFLWQSKRLIHRNILSIKIVNDTEWNLWNIIFLLPLPSYHKTKSAPSLQSLLWNRFKSSKLLHRRRQWHPTPVLLPGKSHGWQSLVGCSPWGCEESDTTERLHFHFSLSCLGEGNGNPVQCSCLENPRDGGAWRAAVYGVTQSRTLLKWLSSSSKVAGSAAGAQ